MEAQIRTRRPIKLAAVLSLALALTPLRATADDTDIFAGSSSGVAGNPNVLIILDNTSNWSTASQHWPDGNKQGQAELLAMRTVIGNLGGSPSVDAPLNVGLMMFTDAGSGRRGGYIRFAIRPMTVANKIAFQNLLTTVYNDFNNPLETTSSSMNYGDVLFDAFKYFGGYTSPAHYADDVAGTPQDATHFGPLVYDTQQNYHGFADLVGYTDGSLTTFAPPSTAAGGCSRNFIIFIGNGFPNSDTYSFLAGVGGDTTEIAEPNFITSTQTITYDGGYGTCSKKSSASVVGNTCDAFSTAVANTSRSLSPNVCSAGQAQWGVDCQYTKISVTPTNPPTYSVPPANKARAADEWARFLYTTDVNAASGPQNVTTYTIDAFYAQQNPDQTGLLMSMARVGGGKYYPASNQGQIETDLLNIFSEIQSVNSTFASANLPISASNRTVNDNQVFIGVFRPDPDLKPRWFGNLKQYKLILDPSTGVALADSASVAAVNPTTGFITECATSFWTTDSSTYWSTVPTNPTSAGGCTTTTLSKWSDSPDGPAVQKGSVAEVIRKGNNPPTTNTTPTWAVNRSMNTLSGSSIAAFTTSSSGLSTNLVNFTRGQDVNDENGNANLTETRPSLHGDVIHSRPLAIDYGGSTGVVAYYGANDGTLRAVQGSSGKEIWSFVANEFFLPRTTSSGNSPLQRLMDNSPLVSYGTTPLAGSQPRDYLFDGSMGIYQNADNSRVWIYPTMRRGGRMIYGLDVTTPGSPTFKWKLGCPNLTSDSSCSGMSGIGQTWSTPNLAFIKGYSTTTPIVAVGGGYDPCEDANSSTPACSSAKGSHVYLIDADTGNLLRTFDTERSVIADIAFADINFDGYPDYAYAVDTGGSIYRIDFVDANKNPLAKDSWVIHTVAYTTGSGRKFQYAPTVLPNQGKVYLALGSGDREHPLVTQYPFTTPVTNRFYVYLDDTSVSPASKAVAVNLDDSSQFADFTSNPSCGGTTILPNSTQKGWFLTLNQHGVGEQTVTSAAIAGGMITFSTNRPIPPSSGTCTTSLGEARGYFVNLFSGSGVIGVPDACGGDQSSTFVGGGLPPSPVLATVVVGGNTETVLIGAVQKGGGASSVVGAQKVLPPLNFARKMIYWFTQGTDNQ